MSYLRERLQTAPHSVNEGPAWGGYSRVCDAAYLAALGNLGLLTRWEREALTLENSAGLVEQKLAEGHDTPAVRAEGQRCLDAAHMMTVDALLAASGMGVPYGRD